MIDQTERDIISRDLIYKVAERNCQDGRPVDTKTVVVHPGPQAWKEVSLLTFLNPETGEIRGRTLQAQTWSALRPDQDGGGYDFKRAAYRWHCEGDHEIEALRAFLNDEIPAPGRYRLVQRGSAYGDLVDLLERGELTTQDVARLLEVAAQTPDLVAAIARSKNGSVLAEAVELQRRRDQLDELREIVEDPDSTERGDIHPLLKKMTWIFGGRYVGEATRRQLSLGDVLDVPLLRADGSLHVVELKGANIPGLIRRHRGPSSAAGNREEVPLVVGAEVNEAIGQAMNYLCHLDEDRDRILAKLKVEARRASATVLIGHPKFVQSISEREIANTFRVYNSYYARIEVMHYRELIESAERSLALATDSPESREDAESVDVHGSTPDARSAPKYYDDPWDGSDLSFSDEPPF